MWMGLRAEDLQSLCPAGLTVSAWSGTGCRLLSFLSVCEILATVASVPVHLSCFGCYYRDQDKQKIRSRQTWDQRIVQASVLGYQWYQLGTMKSPPLVNLRCRKVQHGVSGAARREKQVLLIILVKCAVTSHGCNIRLPLPEHLRED